MRRLAVVACLAAIAGCSIDFVALDETPVATLIEVTSDHTDSVRAEIEISHQGFYPPTARVNGVTRSPPESDPDGWYALGVQVTLDPADPTLEVHVSQAPSRWVSVRIPVVARTGAAVCSSAGVRLPLTFDRAKSAGFRRSWSVDVLDSAGRSLSTIASDEALPEPLVVPRDLVSDSAVAIGLEVRVSGPVEDAPYDAAMSVRTRAAWGVAGPCG